MSMPGFTEAPQACPARWVWHPAARPDEPTVLAFRLPIRLDEAEQVRLHVSADQRYELFLDGERLGRGPQRSDVEHWSFETYDVELTPGPHLLAARVWWLPRDGAPMAQMTAEPGFLVLAEGELAEDLSTGAAPWEVIAIDAYAREPLPEMRTYHVVGWSFALDGDRFPWGWKTDPAASGAWVPAVGDRIPVGGDSNPYYDVDGSRMYRGVHHLHPAALPAMMEETRHAGRVRHVEMGDGDIHFQSLVKAAQHHPERVEEWQQVLNGTGSLAIEANTSWRLIIDLENYYCAYPELVTSGGAGTRITIAWAESLYEEPGVDNHHKGNRDALENKYFRGPGDLFVLEGGDERLYDTLWWRAGRYVEIRIAVGDEPAVIEQLTWRETRYPFEMESAFESSDGTLQEIMPIMYRALQMCSHETYMDTPYYEQLQYVGDTRLEILVTYVTTSDSRLPIRANRLFNWSRASDGFTKSRYPSRSPQVIPPFSLWWIGMVHDLMMWRDEPEVIAECLPGVDAVLAGFARNLTEQHLVKAPRGWNFVDWVPAWNAGWPPEGRHGLSALINLQYLYSLDLAAEIHGTHGQPELAAHWQGVAGRLREALLEAYWDEGRGLLADDPDHEHWSEHAQALALLTDLVEGERRERLIEGLLHAEDLERATIYFTHYLFEALRHIGATDALFERLQEWQALVEQGFRTTRESPEPTRSDCHAWGAHPLYHYYATLLGARPAEAGFRSIHVAPQPGPLEWLRGTLPHATGEMIAFVLRFAQGEATGTITLPDRLEGTFVWQGEEQQLAAGENRIG
jgi:hypothetical protein